MFYFMKYFPQIDSKGAHQKKLAFQLLTILYNFFFLNVKIYMFLNQERPERDDFERRKKRWL